MPLEHKSSAEGRTHEGDDDLVAVNSAASPYELSLPTYVDVRAQTCIRRFLDYTASLHNIYYINQIPEHRKWGGPGGAYLTLVDDIPLRVWVLGKLSKLQVSTSKLDPRNELSVDLAFLRNVDRDSAEQLNNLSRPKTWYHPSTFVTKRPVSATVGPYLYNAVYDATATYCAKTEMKSICPSMLALDDVVLIEFFVYRWRQPRMRTSNQWNSWYITFQVDAISLIVQAPRAELRLPTDAFSGSL
ncbi:hypothetical protein C8Q79DRAFT_1007778 [Trametes meyenii]|nr:hypothetical protein C8Q79DRAFT_1007778 [Trametes meyenii]